MEIFLAILGAILSVVGILGCIIPGLPGPPLNLLALFLLGWGQNWEPFGFNFMLTMVLVTAGVTVLDYIVPIYGARKFGASRAGIWGSVIGMIIGLIFFPPFGIFLGVFAGAVVGEIFVGKNSSAALKAGWGTFIGSMLGLLAKLVASGVMTFYFFKALFR